MIDGAALPALALEAASSVDALIARAPDTLVDSLEGGPSAFLLHRHRHRGDHLEQIRVGLEQAETRAPAAPVDRSYLQRNEASLTRLAELAGRLTPAELTLRVGDGAWTVGQVLGHMAFWDRFLAARWRAALASGAGEQPTLLPNDLADLLNDGLPPTWGAFAAVGRGAIDDTVAAARAVDGIIADLPAATPFEVILAERPALLDRSIHRLEHLSAIDRVLTRR